MPKRTSILAVLAVIATTVAIYALLLHPSCAKRNTYVPELDACVLQRVTCKGLFCSPETAEQLSCGERTNACGAKVTCGCTKEDTTEWE